MFLKSQFFKGGALKFWMPWLLGIDHVAEHCSHKIDRPPMANRLFLLRQRWRVLRVWSKTLFGDFFPPNIFTPHLEHSGLTPLQELPAHLPRLQAAKRRCVSSNHRRHCRKSAVAESVITASTQFVCGMRVGGGVAYAKRSCTNGHRSCIPTMPERSDMPDFRRLACVSQI